MGAGKYRHQITIQTPTASQDAAGSPTSTWATYATVWAAVLPIRGREFFQAQAVHAEQTVRMVTRYLSGVTTKMRISWNSRTFDIDAVINAEERNRELELLCTEVVA